MQRHFCTHIAPLLDGVDNPGRNDHCEDCESRGRWARLTKEEITAFCGLLFIAGGETKIRHSKYVVECPVRL